jgi:hypothetical protein
MFVLPFIESVMCTKLELKFFVFHLWFGNLFPLESYDLLDDVYLDHPLVPHLNDSILPGIAGLLLAEVINDFEERGEQLSELRLVKVHMLLSWSLHCSLFLLQSRGVDVISIVRPISLSIRVEVDLLSNIINIRGGVSFMRDGVASLVLLCLT